MLSFFFPNAFWGLMGIPLLIAIYMLRRRHRVYTVSSLIFWENLLPPDQSGIQMKRLKTRLLFFLELLIILFIVLAAAGPRFLSAGSFRPLTVVLDDSVSMRATDGRQSSRERGADALAGILRTRPFRPVRVLLAGEKPEMLSRTASSDFSRILEEWPCYAPVSRTDSTLAMAKELSGKEGLILLISDHAPAGSPEPGIRWLAVGKALANTAFVNGVRSASGQKDRVLLEISNFSSQAVEKNPEISGKEQPLLLEAHGRKKIVYEINDKNPLTARLPDDALAEDNRLILFPSIEKKAAADIRIVNPALHAVVQRAVRASELGTARSPIPDILFTDSREPAEKNGRTWTVFLISEQKARAYKGPFVADYSHPLLKGISLEGLIWGAGEEKDIPGMPLISVGDIPLLSQNRRPSGVYEIRMRMNMEKSTIAISPAWPELIWNILHWRISRLPGLTESNVRTGTVLPFVPENSVREVRVTYPDQTERDIPLISGTARIETAQTGIYRIRSGKQEESFAANLFSPEESDLSTCREGEWGSWDDFAPARQDYLPLDWIFILLAFAGLLLHQSILNKFI